MKLRDAKPPTPVELGVQGLLFTVIAGVVLTRGLGPRDSNAADPVLDQPAPLLPQMEPGLVEQIQADVRLDLDAAGNDGVAPPLVNDVTEVTGN